MIAIDLSPLVFTPRRGVARALLHLLAGLARTRIEGLPLRGYLPRIPLEGVGLRCGIPTWARVIGDEHPSPRTWRRALAEALAGDGSSVLLSPWAAFPETHVPVVAWIHEVPWVGRGALEGAARTLRHQLSLARAVRRCAALVVPADAVRRDLHEAHPDARCGVHVVPHGFLPRCPTELVASEQVPLLHGVHTLSASIATELPSQALWYLDLEPGLAPPAEPYALLLGTGRGAAGPWKKGVDVFLDAFDDERLLGLAPVLVGDPGRFAGRSRARLRVVDEPDDLEVADLVAAARVVVVPSRSEGFGYPLLEAFAAGVPVVASAAGALPEVAGGAARLVPPGDVEALTDAVLRVHSDEALRARLIEAGLRRASEFPVEEMARGWLRVLTQVGGLPWHG